MCRDVSAFIIILLWSRFVGGSPVDKDQTVLFVSGRVTEEQSGEPIPDVSVWVVDTQLGTSTDLDGRYLIGPLQAGTQVLQFSHVSYDLRRDTLYLTQIDTVTYNVKLVKRSILLKELEVLPDHPTTGQLWKGTSGRVLSGKEIEATGIRDFGELIRHIEPGASVREMGPDLFIDLNKSSRRTTRIPARDYLQNTNPLIFLNGMRIGKSPQGLGLLINPDEIKEIVVLKGTEASMYGNEGRDGVILVETSPKFDPSSLSLFQKLLYVTAVFAATLLTAFLLF